MRTSSGLIIDPNSTHTPYTRQTHNSPMHQSYTTRTVTRVEDSLEHMVPMKVEDSYHFIDTVMVIKNSSFNLPKCMTLARYRYLLSCLSESYKIDYILMLDPLTSVSNEDRVHAIAMLDHDIYTLLCNVMVMCVSSTVEDITSLKVDPTNRVTRFTDEYITGKCDHGLFQLCFRVFTPEHICFESDREFFLRQLACNSTRLSPRSMLMLQDPLFPLAVIPGIGNSAILVDVARSAPTL